MSFSGGHDMKTLWCVVAVLIAPVAVLAEDPTPSQKAITEAIKLLETKRDAIDDAIEAAKVDKAIRDLEALIEDPDAEPKPAPITFNVTPAALKKKFAGKPIFNPKTGELTLSYDFANKSQLEDFKIEGLNVQVAKKMLMIEAGDTLQHVAHFRSFTASGVMTFKSMRGGSGLGSSNGWLLSTGGVDVLQLKFGGSVVDRKPVRNELRSGSVPVSFTITPRKANIRFGTEQLTKPAAATTEVIHQLVLNAGSEGCGFSNLVIVGAPDPAWLKEFLGE
jgi:hypothetical protein